MCVLYDKDATGNVRSVVHRWNIWRFIKSNITFQPLVSENNSQVVTQWVQWIRNANVKRLSSFINGFFDVRIKHQTPFRATFLASIFSVLFACLDHRILRASFFNMLSTLLTFTLPHNNGKKYFLVRSSSYKPLLFGWRETERSAIILDYQTGQKALAHIKMKRTSSRRGELPIAPSFTWYISEILSNQTMHIRQLRLFRTYGRSFPPLPGTDMT